METFRCEQDTNVVILCGSLFVVLAHGVNEAIYYISMCC